MFEVRTETTEQEREHMRTHDVPYSDYVAETRRSERSIAEEDAELLKLFGKKAWIVELDK